MKKLNYYLKVWWMMAKNAVLAWSSNRNVFLVFLLGKIIRFIAYFGFLFLLVRGTNGFLGYSQDQILFVTAVYAFVATVVQFFLRSVYTFRTLVVTGDFDLILTKPLNALFRVLLGGPDPIDLITIPPVTLVMIWLGSHLNPSPVSILFFVLLLINSFLVAAAFHIFVLGLGVITLEVDHLIMVYRDFESMGRYPVDIYKKPLGWILTFVIPVGLMMTIPARALGGLVGGVGVIGSLAVGITIFYLSLKFWNFALTKYTSASS